MNDIVATLGKNIRFLRKNLGWTQEKLAEKSGISVPFMTQIELGRKTASLEVIERISKALNVSYEQLFINQAANEHEPSGKLEKFEDELISSISETVRKKFGSFYI